jgi:TolB-like protein
MNIKRNIVLALLAVSAGSAVAADKPQPPPTVAVYDFTDVDAREGHYGDKITTLVTADLTTETNFVMLERAELKRALGEQAFGASGMVSSDAASKIGQITGAKVLVSGKVIMTDKNHLVIVASIIGTETGRLFAAKVDGSTADLLNLSSDLSHKIAQTIASQTTNLLVVIESRADRLARIIKNIKGINRPSVSLNFEFPHGKNLHAKTVEAELGNVLQQAGFTVVDDKSDHKPDVEITGRADTSPGPRRGDLFSSRANIEIKVQERRNGVILAVDHQETTATDASARAADLAAQVGAVCDIAERILPVLAKDR